jgi:hypothetical protein
MAKLMEITDERYLWRMAHEINMCVNSGPVYMNRTSDGMRYRVIRAMYSEGKLWVRMFFEEQYFSVPADVFDDGAGHQVCVSREIQ